MLEGFLPTKSYQTKEEYIFETLRDAILQCKIQPEERLVIDHLASTFGVSSIPIRTVLQRLQSEGLVEITPHAGAVVSSISPDTIDELFSILGLLEGIAFLSAAQKIKDSDINQLESILNEMDKAASNENADQWSDYNRNFHIRIAEIAQMGLVVDFTKRVLDRWDRMRRFYMFKEVFSHRLAKSQGDHRLMFELLKQRKGEELVETASQHNAIAKQAYINWIHTHVNGEQKLHP